VQDDTSCLYIAAAMGHVEVVKHLVEKGGRELLMLTAKGRVSCLFVAAQVGRVEVVKHLVEKGERELLIITREHLHDTCLDAAARGGHLDCLECLLASGGLELLMQAGASEGRSKEKAEGSPIRDAGSRPGDQAEDATPREPKAMTSLGVNSSGSLRTLKRLLSSIKCTMLLVPFTAFKACGKIPRSDDKMTVQLIEIPGDGFVLFVSHRWLRPDGDPPHPDGAEASKWWLICLAAERLAEEKGLPLDKLYLWVDFCGIEQDIEEEKLKGIDSLLAYIAATSRPSDCLQRPVLLRAQPVLHSY